MPKAQVLALAGRFFTCWPDCTDMAQDVENALRDELEGMDEDEAADLVGEVTAAVEKCFTEAAAMLNLKAQRMIEERTMQERRVAAVVNQFELVSGVLTGPGEYDDGVDIPRLTDALFGKNGVVGA